MFEPWAAVDLSCDAYLAQQGNPRIEWKFEKGETVTLLYRDSQFTEPYKGCVQFTPSSIHFSSVTRKDTGKYICEVLGESGQLSKSEVNLIVQVAPSKPVASVPASVTIGNKAELTCKESDGSPPPTFLWYRNNIQMPVNPNTSEAFKNSSYELNPKTGQLTFDPVTGFDSGDYYCEAQNNIGTPQKSDTYRLEASELNVGAIVATVVVLLILLGLIAFGIWFAYSRGYFNKRKDLPKGVMENSNRHRPSWCECRLDLPRGALALPSYFPQDCCACALNPGPCLSIFSYPPAHLCKSGCFTRTLGLSSRSS
ncbi:junctional adhesion molecule A [Alligator mississippiensis]|uniref:Junctional adhesion molecule A n=1 Tax=Alligator mississippiensis TaxID=8496 RepID=A0A151MPJ7_ALLMI|nr:junctional adhesion molecule A [Alligator mississippiensis]